jgi:hypothetical protein
MKKLLLSILILCSLHGYSQWHNLTTAGMPAWSTSARPAGLNGEYGFNTDSAKVQVYYGGTWYTMSSSGGAGNTYTGSGGVQLTASNFTLQNDSPSIATGNYYYGFSTSPSAGRYGFWPLPGGVSGLTAGYVPYATSATSLGNSGMYYTSSTGAVTFNSGGWSSYINKSGTTIQLRAALVALADSGTGYVGVGLGTQYNSGIFNVSGVSTFVGNAWFGSATGNGLRINFGTPLVRLDNETSGGGIFFRTNAVANSNLSLYTGGNSGFNSATDDGDAILQSYGTTLPQLEAAYNSSNRFTIQTNSSGNATLTSTGGLVTIPTQVTVGPNGGTLTWNPSTQVPFVTGGGTLNDATTAASGTVTNVDENSLTGATLTATNTSITYTNAYNVLINQAPSAGTHVSITNPYALGVIGPAIFQTQLSTVSLAIYNWQTVTTGTASTINNSQTNWLLNLSSLAATYTVTLPAAPIDGQLVKLHFGGTISGGSTVVTALTVSANSGQTIVQSAIPTTALSGNCYIYEYNAALSIWYREQ